MLVSLPVTSALGIFVKASLEIIGGYSAAVGNSGDWIEIAGAAQTVAWIALLLFLQRTADRKVTWYFALLLAVPLFMSFKHGFIRQDIHIINFFGFVALALAMVSIGISLEGRRLANASLILLPMLIIWTEYMFSRIGLPPAIAEASGYQAVSNAVDALNLTELRTRMWEEAKREYPAKARVEPEILDIVKDTARRHRCPWCTTALLWMH